jgi:glutamyl-tRNA synthetase
VYAHLPTVLNEQGEKMSKRSGARLRDPILKATCRRDGELPGGWAGAMAMTRSSVVNGFLSGSIWITGQSAAQFDEPAALGQRRKPQADETLAALVQPFLAAQGRSTGDRASHEGCALFKDR